MAGILSAMIAWVRVCYIRAFIQDWMRRELERKPAEPDIEAEWRRLSKDGSNPVRVVALATKMAAAMTSYAAAKHLTSAFHSQVKFLAKKGKLLLGFAFYLEDRKWAKITLFRRKHTAEKKEPIDLEILGAFYFGVATVPYVGWFLGMFGYKKRALAFLKEADAELMDKSNELDPLQAAMIWSKLYTLTGNERFRLQTQYIGLNANMDEGQLKRIAKYLGFKNLDQLQRFCTYPA